MQKSLLKYANYSIVFQEVPNETSLAINITGCPHHCEGCHSEYLANDVGNYVDDDLPEILSKYKNEITCVCFMGGDQCMDNLLEWLFKIKTIYNLKTCVYSGSNDINIFNNCLKFLDYLKIGSYQKNKGGLDSKITNQTFYIIESFENEYKLIKRNDLFIKNYLK